MVLVCRQTLELDRLNTVITLSDHHTTMRRFIYGVDKYEMFPRYDYLCKLLPRENAAGKCRFCCRNRCPFHVVRRSLQMDLPLFNPLPHLERSFVYLCIIGTFLSKVAQEVAFVN